jgi:hypothetical protein
MLQAILLPFFEVREFLIALTVEAKQSGVSYRRRPDRFARDIRWSPMGVRDRDPPLCSVPLRGVVRGNCLPFKGLWTITILVWRSGIAVRIRHYPVTVIAENWTWNESSRHWGFLGKAVQIR